MKAAGRPKPPTSSLCLECPSRPRHLANSCAFGSKVSPSGWSSLGMWASRAPLPPPPLVRLWMGPPQHWSPSSGTPHPPRLWFPGTGTGQDNGRMGEDTGRGWGGQGGGDARLRQRGGEEGGRAGQVPVGLRGDCAVWDDHSLVPPLGRAPCVLPAPGVGRGPASLSLMQAGQALHLPSHRHRLPGRLPRDRGVSHPGLQGCAG